MSPKDWAFISTVPPFVGLSAALATDTLLLGRASRLEGLGLRRNPLPGALRGVLGILMVWPMIMLISALTEWFYEVHHYAHPQEHELLKAMGDTTNQLARGTLIVGAVILAPLFEELIFRAHIQTFLRELLCRMTGVLPVIGAPQTHDEVAGALSDARPIELHEEQAIPSRGVALQTWTAIVLASALFTSVHPRWMWPPIFFLAIGLGYAYERTGNLWTSIVMHALFNAASTYQFLSQSH